MTSRDPEWPDPERASPAAPRTPFLGYCKHMFQVLPVMFHIHVTSVSCECCKSKLEYYICCNGYTRMLQAHVLNVSAVSDGCCTCFIWVLHIFYSCVASVSSGCCICFHTYVASVSFRGCICFAMAAHVFQMYIASVSTVLDVCCKCFPLDVTKVDLILHMLRWNPSAAAAWVWRGHKR
jgi:hypothetical protein